MCAPLLANAVIADARGAWRDPASGSPGGEVLLAPLSLTGPRTQRVALGH